MVLKIFSQRESKRSRAFNLFEYTREGADALARNTALCGQHHSTAMEAASRCSLTLTTRRALR